MNSFVLLHSFILLKIRPVYSDGWHSLTPRCTHLLNVFTRSLRMHSRRENSLFLRTAFWCSLHPETIRCKNTAARRQCAMQKLQRNVKRTSYTIVVFLFHFNSLFWAHLRPFAFARARSFLPLTSSLFLSHPAVGVLFSLSHTDNGTTQNVRTMTHN